MTEAGIAPPRATPYHRTIRAVYASSHSLLRMILGRGRGAGPVKDAGPGIAGWLFRGSAVSATAHAHWEAVPLGLQRKQCGVTAASGRQLVMGAPFYDLPGVEHQD